ncbi:MAG: Ig-like domain-containing protein [Arenicellales bacterium WSBS_2016_MAG_OTU3]
MILTFTYTPPDIIRPTVMLASTLTSADASDTTFDVTATFSEPVTGFDAIADITVTDGTAAARFR